jgi:phospholipid-binding lipoprotein MlaA
MGARDLLDPLVMNNALNPVKHFMHKDFKLASTVISTIDTRHQIMPFTDYISKNSTDPYIAVRDATISNREAKMLYPDGFKCPAVNKK